VPTQSTLPTSFTLPGSGSSALHAPSSSGLDLKSLILNDCDWSRGSGSGSMMDLDVPEPGRISAVPTSKKRKLEFADGALSGLEGLDISFEASHADNGKIRVRIHSPSTSSTGSDARMPPYASSLSPPWSSSDSLPASEASSDSLSGSLHSVSSIESDPFLGMSTSSAFELPHYASDDSLPMSWYGNRDLSSSADFCRPLFEPDFGFGSEFGASGKRRVRIALKSMPTAGGEGGEWEVQFC
jgi:hypothetical protein